MRFGDLLGMSLGNYGRARLRSGLTTAGVAIGTALVVLLIALATGAEDNVRRSIFSIGDLRLVTVQPFQPGANGLSAVPRTITDDTVAKLKDVAHVEGVYRQFDAPLGMVAVPALRVERREQAPAIPAARRLGPNFLAAIGTSSGLIHDVASF